jgi:putative membrane protein
MLRRLLLRWAIITVAIAVAAAIVPSVDVHGGFFSYVGVALIFGLVNAIIGSVVRLLALPLTIVTFGLFALVINALMLAITAGLTDALDVGGFLSTVVAGLVISLLTTLLHVVFLRERSSRRRST